MVDIDYIRLSNRIDNMDEEEKLFTVWYLMDFLKEHVQKEADDLGEKINKYGLTNKTMKHAYDVALNDSETVNRLRIKLYYEIF